MEIITKFISTKYNVVNGRDLLLINCFMER